MIPAPAFTPIYIVVTRLSAEFWIPSRKFQPLSKLGWDPVFCGANAEHANGGVVAIESLEPRTIHLNQWKEASIDIRHKIRDDHRGRHRICEKCIHRRFFAVRLAQRLVSEILELDKWGSTVAPHDNTADKKIQTTRYPNVHVHKHIHRLPVSFARPMSKSARQEGFVNICSSAGFVFVFPGKTGSYFYPLEISLWKQSADVQSLLLEARNGRMEMYPFQTINNAFYYFRS